MTDKLTQDQEDILVSLNAADWSEVVSEFGEKDVEEIKSELDIMFWGEKDTNLEYAQKIYNEIKWNS